MPNIGQFVLHSLAEPPLKAGDYVLHGTPGRSPAAPTEPRRRTCASPRRASRCRPTRSSRPSRRPTPRAPSGTACRRSCSSAARCRGSARPSSAAADDDAVARARRHRRGRGRAVGRHAGRAVRDAGRRCCTGPQRRRRPATTSRSPQTVVDKVFPTAEDLPLLVTCARSTSTTPSWPTATTTASSRWCWPTGCRQYDRRHGQAGALPRLPRQPRGPARRAAAADADRRLEFVADRARATTCASSRSTAAAVDADRVVMGGIAGAAAVRALATRAAAPRDAPRAPSAIATRGARPPAPRRRRGQATRRSGRRPRPAVEHVGADAPTRTRRRGSCATRWPRASPRPVEPVRARADLPLPGAGPLVVHRARAAATSRR